MFKTLCHIVISLLLLTATTGMAVSKHFCDELLVSTSLYGETNSCCGEDSCCHHETDFVQLQEKFQPSQNAEVPYSAEIELMVADMGQLLVPDSEIVHAPVFVEKNPPPPPKIQTSLSLRQVYLL